MFVKLIAFFCVCQVVLVKTNARQDTPFEEHEIGKRCRSKYDCFNYRLICFEGQCMCSPKYPYNNLLKKCGNYSPDGCWSDQDCHEFGKNCFNGKCKCDGYYHNNGGTNKCEERTRDARAIYTAVGAVIILLLCAFLLRMALEEYGLRQGASLRDDKKKVKFDQTVITA